MGLRNRDFKARDYLTLVAGVDPGLSGAIAILGDSTLTVLDMPTLQIKGKRILDLYALAQFFDLNGNVKLATIEDPHAMPGQGVSSMFKFGFNCGAVQAMVASAFIPMKLVSPASWKGAMGLGKDKDASRRLASQIMPRFSHLWARAKDDGRAEAALLALYGSKTL
jgi:crossover junction endodeoxyribonuclease RuvC